MSKTFEKAITPVAYHSYDQSRWPIMEKLVECFAHEGGVGGKVGAPAGGDRVLVRTVAYYYSFHNQRFFFSAARITFCTHYNLCYFELHISLPILIQIT